MGLGDENGIFIDILCLQCRYADLVDGFDIARCFSYLMYSENIFVS